MAVNMPLITWSGKHRKENSATDVKREWKALLEGTKVFDTTLGPNEMCAKADAFMP